MQRWYLDKSVCPSIQLARTLSKSRHGIFYILLLLWSKPYWMDKHKKNYVIPYWPQQKIAQHNAYVMWLSAVFIRILRILEQDDYKSALSLVSFWRADWSSYCSPVTMFCYIMVKILTHVYDSCNTMECDVRYDVPDLERANVHHHHHHMCLLS